ncbi:MAG: S1/P1 nuclease [Elusimicrobia bacterium]|nr:S1/P1 nuclease [Elusimicrobiota bacterium]
MGKPAKAAALAGLCLLSCAASSRAWGPLGHKAVASVAESLMSDQARENVAELLGGGSSLADISNCADTVLYTKDPVSCAGFTLDPAAFTQTKPWHYINIPIATTDLSDMTALCKNGQDCVTAQIRAQTLILKDPSPHVTMLQRQAALMLLVHCMGDVHQPFHAIDDADWGGNAKKLVFQGALKNLHMLWDDLIMKEDWREQAKMAPAPLVASLDPLDISAVVTYSGGGEVGDEAARESFELAKGSVYPVYKPDQHLDEHYQAHMQPLAEQRLFLAGKRLGWLLDEIFGAGYRGTPPPAASVRNAATDRALGMISATVISR